jgi:VanZ family protein
MVVLRRLILAALILYWGFALTMTHIPHPPPIGPQVSYKLIHFLAYGLLSGLLFLALWISRPNLRWLPLIVLGIIMAYAAFDELTQPLFHRDCEFGDWLADSAAGVVAVSVLGLIRHFARSRIAPPGSVR